jgi:alcohol dehydrogenase class IV
MFQLTTNLFHGPNSTFTLIDELKKNGVRRIIVLIDKSVATHSDYWSVIRKQLALDFDIKVLEILIEVEPTYDFLDELSSQVRLMHGYDYIIGIGGGSLLDLTKAVAALYANPGDAIQYRGFDKVLNPGLKSVCIPTTAGTGSEVTINAVFTDSAEMKKLGINGKNMAATYAVLDAKFTESCPRNVALSSGLDALVHTLESFTAKQSSSVTRMLSITAFKFIYNSLVEALNRNDEDARQSMLLGSYFAGAALFNSGSGISGAISYPVGVHFKVPHGFAGGITLPSVIKMNIQRGWNGYAALLDAVETTIGLTDEEKSNLFLSRILELYEKIKAPTDFSKWGITKSNIPMLVENCKNLQPAFDQNPVYFSAEVDSRLILEMHTP